MLAIAGWGSAISQQLLGMVPSAGYRLDPDKPPAGQLQPGTTRVFVASGYLAGRSSAEHTDETRRLTTWANFDWPTMVGNAALQYQAHPLRICILGSASAMHGSYDPLYARAKERVHGYIERTPVRRPGQQLVGIAPGVVSDAGMTTRRTDQAQLQTREQLHPQQQFVTAADVARLAYWLLYTLPGRHVCNTVVLMNGGEHTVRR